VYAKVSYIVRLWLLSRELYSDTNMLHRQVYARHMRRRTGVLIQGSCSLPFPVRTAPNRWLLLEGAVASHGLATC
jgi:hypothetical protein